MENYIKIKEAKPNNNEYVLLRTSVHDSKPKKLLYTNNEFIDFQMEAVSVEDDYLWKPFYGINPITQETMEVVDKKEDVEGFQVDSYASNEYITTFINKGHRYMYIHKKGEISSRWTELDD